MALKLSFSCDLKVKMYKESGEKFQRREGVKQKNEKCSMRNAVLPEGTMFSKTHATFS